MKYEAIALLASLGLAAASPIGKVGYRPPRMLRGREVPQEHSHEQFITTVRASLNLNNPNKIQDPIFGLLGNAAASVGQGTISNTDCLHQATADQAFSNAKAAGDINGMTAALIYAALERNTGSVGTASVLCTAIAATNPEIAAISQHQDPASTGAAATNKAVTLALAVQIASIGGDPQLASKSGTFAPGKIGDPTAKGNSCDTQNDPIGCIFTQNLLVVDATPAEISAAVAGVSVATVASSAAATTAAAVASSAAASTAAVATTAAAAVAASSCPAPVTVTVMMTMPAAVSSVAAIATTAANSSVAAVIATTAANSSVAAVIATTAANSSVAAVIATTAANSSVAAVSTSATVCSAAAAAATAAATAAAVSATSAAAASGSNVQTFTGALGGISAPPVIFTAGSGRPFSTDGSTFVNSGAAIQRSCSVQHNKCANAANAGTLAGGESQCETQQSSCNALIGSKKMLRRAALNFGSCSNPAIDFGQQSDRPNANAFIAANQADFNHGSALNIGVIAGFICQRLGSPCNAAADAIAACTAGQTAASALTGQAAADAFNAALGLGSSAGGAVASTTAAAVAGATSVVACA